MANAISCQKPSIFRSRLLGCTAVLSVVQALTGPAWAQSTQAPGTLPSGGQVQAGAASIATAGTAMTVTQTTDKAIISWNQFNIGSAASVTFQQPGSSSMTLNRVRGGEGSLIEGALRAPGTVILINPNGVIFGGGSTVDVGGIVASTLDIADEDFEKGNLSFKRGTSDGAITNRGSITARGGSVVLLASQITNRGYIRAELGSVVLAAGETVTLKPDGGAPLKVDASLIRAEIEAGGIIQTSGGTVYLSARALNKVNAGVIKATGVIEADSLTDVGGTIVLDGSGPITLQGALFSAKGATGGGTVLVGDASATSVVMDADSRIDASAVENGKGGKVIINSRDTTTNGVILARGGKLWGDGGFIETSGHKLAFDGVRVDVGAITGKAGNWLLDPINLTINAAYASAIQTALASSNVTLQTTNTAVNVTGVAAGGTTAASSDGDIFVNSGITWSSANSLTLDAYRGVTVNSAISGSNLSILTNQGGTAGTFAAYAAVDLTTGLTINGTGYTLLTSASQLASIGSTGSYALARNITATGTWTPVGFNVSGDNTAPTAFAGTLEGLGHQISGLSINATGSATSNLGLFSSLDSAAQVQNLILTGGVLFGGTGSNFGLLAGQNLGTVRNVAATGTVTGGVGSSNVGGLIGTNQGTVTASSAGVSVSVNAAASNIGGLIGRQTSGNVLLSYATGNVTAGTTVTNVGGLVGRQTGGTISGAYAEGNVRVGNSSDAVGGLIGNAANIILSSYSSGTVSAADSAARVGGLVGTLSGSVAAAYAVTPVTVGNNATSVGGLVGENSGSISAAYSTGTIVTGAGGASVGGFIGSNSGTVAIGFFDTATSGLSVAFGSDTQSQTVTAIGASTTLSATYAGFDYSATWYQIDGRTRPFLRSEYSTIINNAHQLQLMSMDVTAAYRLGTNINLSRVTLQSDMWSTAGFTPIGFTTVSVNNSPSVFTGSFDGQGFTVSSMTVNPVGYNNVGLFSSIGSTGSVANLTLANAVVATGFPGTVVNSWGLLAGKSSGLVSNVSASGTFSGTRVSTVGGLIGGLIGGTILNSSTGIVFTAGTQVTALGGLAGFTTGSASISNTFATGGISLGNQNQRIGGLLGDAVGLSLANSYATGNINGSASGVQYVGGLIGLNNSGTVSDSYATGNVSLGSASQRVGGLVGYSTGLVTNTYATGDVSLAGTNNQYIGGLVGLLAQPTSGQTSARVIDSYATGNLLIGNGTAVGTAGIYVGGLVGLMQNGIISSSYAIGNVSMGRTATYVGGAVGSMEAFNLTMSSVLGSYASGIVSLGSVATDVGGLVGRSNGGLISSSYANGSITASSTGTLTFNGVGGLVGNHTVSGSFPSTLMNAWSSVAINLPVSVSAGGAIGRMLSGTVSSIYWDTSASGLTAGYGTSTGGTFSATGISGTAAFATSSYSGFDFTNTWFMVDGYTRPFLQAEKRSTIVNAHQLQLISANPSGNFVLGANISMAELALTSGLWNTATGFVPIGFNTSGSNASPTNFTGTLNGQGRTISGLTISNSSSGNIGLFSSIGTAGTVASLTLTGARISAGSVSSAGLVAGQNNGLISTVSAAGTVLAGSGAQMVGGLVGSNAGRILASNASGVVTVANAAQRVGGLAGYNTGTIGGSYAVNAVTVGDNVQSVGGLVGYDSGIVSASYVNGMVVAGVSAQSVGGLVGSGNGLITASYSEGTVSAGSAAQYVGGLAGSLAAGGTVSASYSAATILAGSGAANVGGLVGTNAGRIANAYFIGALAVGSAGSSIGGLAGSNTGTITGVYATGRIDALLNPTLVGGLVGNNGGTLSGYWDTSTTGKTVGYGTNSSSASVTGISGTAVYASTTYSGFDFTNDWYLVEGATRPFLRSEYSTTITSAHQLQLVNLNLSASYTLGRSIDLSEIRNSAGLWNTSTGFLPLGFTGSGDNSSPGSFTGTLNGQGHAINNLYINNSGISNVALFASVGSTGALHSVGVYNGTVVGGAGNAALLAASNAGTILSAYATGRLTAGSGANAVGGLVGANSGTISIAYATAGVTAGANAGSVGGLVGSNSGLISTGYASGQVTVGSGAGSVGAFAGTNAGTIANVYWDASTSGQTVGAGGGSGSFAGTSVTGTDAYANATYSGLNLTSTWYMIAGYTRPLLRMEYSTIISNAHQLQMVNLSMASSYTLGANITMDELAQTGSLWASTGFVPLGFNTAAANSAPTMFTGVLDGMGRSISGLSINNTVSDNLGLISYNSGVVRNLTIAGARIAVAANVGVGVVAGQSTGKISNVYASGTISATGSATYVGGLVGYHGGTMGNAGANVTLLGGDSMQQVGGLVGINAGLISAAFANGAVSIGTSVASVGGLVGRNSGTITSSYAGGAVSVSYGSSIGGLVGSNQGTIASAYSTGTVVTDNASVSVGALVGSNQSSVSTSYWDTTTSGMTVGIGDGTTAGATGLATSAWVTSGPMAQSVFSTVDWVSGSPYPLLKALPSINLSAIAYVAYGSTTSSSSSVVSAYDNAGRSITSGLSTSSLIWTVNGTGTTSTLNGNGANYTGGAVYQFSYDGSVSVTPANLTITASNATAIYGVGATLTGYTASGLVSGDSVASVTLLSPGTSTTSAAGTYTISASGATGTGLSNYSITYVIGSLVINPAALTITASGATKTYGNSANLTGFTSSGLINSDIISNVTLSSSGSGTTANAGSYTISASGATGTGLSNYSITYADGTLVVNPAALTITASGATKTYGNSASLTGFTSSGLINSDSISAVSLTSSGSGTTATVGSYSIVGSGATGTGLSNYSITYANGTLVVNPATLTITASNVTKTYGNSTSVSGYTSTGLVNGDILSAVSIAASGGTAATANVGSYTISASGATGTGLSNYSITYANGTLVVNPATLTITASNVTKTYGNSTSVSGYTSTGLVNGDILSAVSIAASGGTAATANAGSYTISASGATGTGLSNYSITYADGTLVVNPASLTVTASGATKTYGNSVSLTGFTSSGLVNSDSISSVSLSSTGSGTAANAGSYTISASGASGSGLSNYSITYANGTLVVNPAALTITASGATKTYGNSANLTGFTSSGLINSDSISAVSLSSTGSGTAANAGSYTISASGATGTGLSNYSITYADGTLVVNQASLTVTASGATKTYGTSANLTGFTSNGLLNSDSISAVSLASSGSGTTATVGSYSIVGSGATGTGLSNYSITYANGTLVVNQASLTVTASGATKTYGTSTSLTGFTSNGLVNGDSISSVSLSSSGTSTLATVGSYSIVGSGATGTGLSNYSITYANGTLAVNPAALTVTASGATKTYGASTSLTGFTSSGLINGDSINSVSLSSSGAGTLATVGSYSIVGSGATGTGLSNYSITYAEGTLVVNPAALTITASGATKTYGASTSLTGFTSNGLLNSDSISAVSLASSGAGTTATVGSYSIVGSGATGTGLSNYSITYANGTLVVNPATLTVTASASTKTYGASTSLTGFTSNGLINGDSISAVSLNSSGAGTASSVGTYTINASGATGTGLSNYSITYATGTLTVNPAALTVTARDATKTYGNAISLTGFISNGLVNGDSISNITLTSGGVGATADAGTYNITASNATGAGLTNYTISYVDGSMVVNSAALTITAAGARKTYGTSANLTGFSSSGLLNGDSISSVNLSSAGADASAGTGSYAIVGSGANGAGLSNYSITYVAASLVVDPASLTIAASDAVKAYGSSLNLTGFSANGLVNGDSISSIRLTSGGADANAAIGQYTIQASDASGTGLSNYVITYATGNLSVGKAILTVTASNSTKLYGSSISLSDFTIAGLLDGDSVSAVTLNSAGVIGTATVGSYAINASNVTGSGLDNYAISYVAGTLTVTPANLTITAGNNAKTYGATAALAGFNVSGLLNGDSVGSVTLSSLGANAQAGVGSYSVNASDAVGAGLSNYNITYNPGTLTVNPAVLSITARNAGKTYGETVNLSGFNTAGLLNGDQVSSVQLSSAGNAATAGIGSYSISASGAVGTGLSNYTITYGDGTLTVDRASLTVSANNVSHVYGTTGSLAGYSVTGLVNGDQVTGANLTANGLGANMPVGEYGISISNATGTGLGNYNITYADGKVTVTPATLTITAGSLNKTYGTTATVPGYSVAGLVNGDTISAVNVAAGGLGASASAGSYTVAASGATGSGLSNYDINYVNGTLTVNRAALTITAGNNSKTYGSVANLTGYSAAGLVNGDTLGQVALSSAGVGTAASVGSYGITASAASGTGLSNYDITYVGGTLVVNPAALTITAANASKTYGTAAGLTGFSTSGLLNGDSISSVSLSSAGSGTTASVGNYGITASGAAGTGVSNYAITYVGGTLVVNPAALTITAANATKVGGTELSLTGFSTNGLVNGDSVGSVTLASSGTPASAVAGTYAISASSAAGTGLGNYTIRYEEGQLTVTPAPSTLNTSAIQRIVVTAVIPTVSITTNVAPASVAAPATAAPTAITNTTTPSASASTGGSGGGTASTGSSTSTTSSGSTDSNGGGGSASGSTTTTDGTKTSGGSEGGSVSGEAQPILVSGAGGDENVYSQIQMTSDPIKGTENDERQQ